MTRPAVGSRVYAALLRAYPHAFRAEFGGEMSQLFRDQWQRREGTALGFWSAVLWDVLRTAPRMQWDHWRTRTEGARASQQVTPSLRSRNMRITGMLATVVGALLALNAGLELAAGGFPAGDTAWQVVGLAGTLTGALLVVSGIALLRNRAGAVNLARVTALLCLACYAIARGVQPVYSIASTLLGIIVPIAMLVMLRNGNRDASAKLAT